jgi:nitrogen fixation protein FixH
MSRTFTGWHMTGILVTFFGVIIAVNVLMAHYAISTFSGTVVDNSYVASQEFNNWLAQAKKQDQLGWTTRFALDDTRHPEVTVAVSGTPLSGISATGVAQHPLGRAPDIALQFVTVGDGTLRAVQTLPPGRWQVHVEVRHGTDVLRKITVLQ